MFQGGNGTHGVYQAARRNYRAGRIFQIRDVTDRVFYTSVNKYSNSALQIYKNRPFSAGYLIDCSILTTDIPPKTPYLKCYS